MLRTIEQATRKSIELLNMPTTADINDRRIDKFKTKITDTLDQEGLGFFKDIIEQYRQEHNVPSLEIAAALAKIAQGDEPLLLEEFKRGKKSKSVRESLRSDDRPRREERDFDERRKRDKSEFKLLPPAKGMERFRIEVGYTHGVKPGNIVGAISNEAGLDAKHIGRIELYDDFSTVDLPEGMPREVLRVLKKSWVAGQQMRITRMDTPSKRKTTKKNRESRGENAKPRSTKRRSSER